MYCGTYRHIQCTENRRNGEDDDGTIPKMGNMPEGAWATFPIFKIVKIGNSSFECDGMRNIER